jgi:ABC-type multidrug transport system ATPase subunit
MLELSDITLEIKNAADGPVRLLGGVFARWPRGHLGAVLGPSGCGKSTLLRIVAGIREPTGGSVLWEGQDLEEKDLPAGRIAYVPQFILAHEVLTVRENVDYAVRLRVAGLSGRTRRGRVEEVLARTGLLERADQSVRLLSGGQKRRLSLALELVSRPALLLADEVTSGLDPHSETEIVALLQSLAREEQQLVLSVTHSLQELEAYDSVTVLYQGVLAYQGRAEHLPSYFEVAQPADLYRRLAEQTKEEWQTRWQEAGGDYLNEIMAAAVETPPEERPERVPGLIGQTLALTSRRWKLFFRERGQVGLQAALLLLFPVLVVLFALKGLPQIENLSMNANDNVVQQLRETVKFTEQTSRIGTLVSGLVMFQVVLLTLAASNNSAREVVAGRLLLEKEKLAGLNPGAFLISRVVFLSVLVFAQSFWMTVFVKVVCTLPGDLPPQFVQLLLVNASVTATCLAVSSWARTTEQASLISVYFVGFQLPLSGALLALPDWAGTITRPFIAAYWGWSGYLQTLRDTRFYELVTAVSSTPLSPFQASVGVLVVHTVLALFIAHLGCERSAWSED